MNPYRFYDLVDVHKIVSQGGISDFLEEFGYKLATKRLDLEDECDAITELYDRFVQEAKQSTKHRIQSDWATSEEHHEAQDAHRNTFSRTSFLSVVNTLARQSRDTFQNLQDLVELLQPIPLMLNGDRSLRARRSFQSMDMQQIAYEMQINSEALTRFVTGVVGLREGRKYTLQVLDTVVRLLDGFYNALVQRHSSGGIPIFTDPLLTDIALCIYENVDSHGEIEDGTDPDKVSAYSVKKATVLVEAASSGKMGEFLQDPKAFLLYVKGIFRSLWEDLGELEERFDHIIQKVHKIVNPYAIYAPILDSNLEQAMRALDMVDPRNVSYRELGTLMSPEERHAHAHWAGTIEGIVKRLSEKTDSTQLVRYVLERKAELKAWQRDENSFYVCRIGSGNQFRGVAPGALEVVPGDRPTAKLEEIVGGGFEEVRNFLSQVESAAKWHDLFVATSPSRSADKSNVLLIGPQGCGKTEVLRGVGADKNSTSIFAVGSDFNTCWLGEASKNPKRLFQEGVRLQKKTNKHVHFLIDEIDAILNNDRQNAGYINLTLEFQVLMDGVVAYPHLSVWGTTNNPNRIPMPMIRRFSKVAIVGELDLADRIRLLKHFSGFLPCDGVTDAAWEGLASKLEGATGDVIRKIVDTVWRETMTDFVMHSPEDAEVLIKWLNRDAKFDVGSFNGKDRQDFHNMLGGKVVVTAEKLDASVGQALRNVAILHEIETAKEVYADAKIFMASVTEERS